LKQTILNVLREALRARARRPIDLNDKQWDWCEPVVNQSLSSYDDRAKLINYLVQAAAAFQQECLGSRTQGRRRLFDILRRTVVQGESAARIGTQLGLDRTSVSDLLAQARVRFLEIWQEVSGDADGRELKRLLRREPETFRTVLASLS
jgi:hypothetical protein